MISLAVSFGKLLLAPLLRLPAHGFEVALHAVDADRKAVLQGEVLRVFGQDRREHARGNVTIGFVDAGPFDRHRGGDRPPTPATPPCVRVRTRRFEMVTLTFFETAMPPFSTKLPVTLTFFSTKGISFAFWF